MTPLQLMQRYPAHTRACNVMLVSNAGCWQVLGLLVSGLVLGGIEHEAEDFAECKECTNLAIKLGEDTGHVSRHVELSVQPQYLCDRWEDSTGLLTPEDDTDNDFCDSFGKRPMFYRMGFYMVWSAIIVLNVGMLAKLWQCPGNDCFCEGRNPSPRPVDARFNWLMLGLLVLVSQRRSNFVLLRWTFANIANSVIQ